ncbi:MULTISPECIES: hypothetical protein [Thioalkalivibrio]|uniref:Uncharacterized protein n=1 Tax=Thioalkalivibrio versutus TaxID=106634 RepID=A0A0G3G3H3_9GAMM|nr:MULTISPECIES: hypothetical protein [Thioalkalivibrio]AKJ95753.1 hypothetical protein TVD_10465 [Thioalkalivibrio versutus]OOC48979.1 hypothetical protein B0684_06890 [Thioalkalivibrio versutus]
MALNFRWTPALVVVVLALGVGACSVHKTETRGDGPEPRPGTVEQMNPFLHFLESRPTPAEFGRVYPDVMLVLPGDIVTQEYRTDHSRFFADLDDENRIRGGEFR